MFHSDRLVVVALSAVAVALVLVGVVSETLLRHAIQITPILASIAICVWRPALGRAAAIPLFGFWLFIMTLIWLYLLGIADIVTGRFTRVEIALTLVIGVASVVGLAVSLGKLRLPHRGAKAALFVAFLAFQVFAMWVSLQPAVANR